MNADESFPRLRRIRSSSDFDRIYSLGTVAADGQLVMHAAPNQLGYCRLGVSISRQFGNSPQRNRWKRVIREAFRRSKRQLPPGMDLVVRPKRGAKCDSLRVRQSLLGLAARLAKKLELGS